jgi:hypothetical protein
MAKSVKLKRIETQNLLEASNENEQKIKAEKLVYAQL